MNKKDFIKSLYLEFIRMISGLNEEETDNYNFGDFKRLNKNSQIIKEYFSL